MKRLILSLFLVSPLYSFANGSGTILGNGGQSVVCRNDQKEIVSAEALDLFEGRALDNRRVAFPEDRAALELAVELATKIDDSQGGPTGRVAGVAGKVKYVAANMTLLPPGVGLDPIDDSLGFIFPKNCEPVQTINFRENQRIFVDSDVWNLLPETSKAALLLHEAVYWHLRESGVEKDSRRTRRVVAFMLAGGQLPPRAKFELPAGTEIQHCHSVEINSFRNYNSSFFAFRKNDLVMLQFMQIGGYRLLGRTLLVGPADTPDLPLQKDAEKTQKVEGWFSNPPDTEAFVSVSWGQGLLSITGKIQDGGDFQESLECEAWTL